MSNSPAQHKALDETAAEHFLRHWLHLIDSGAAPTSFYPFLVDGPFEEWSYPGGISLADRAALEAYFQATWGAIREQQNQVEALDVSDRGDGTFQVVARALWTATTGDGQRMVMPLTYTIVLGAGSSVADPDGQHPKVRRYRVEVTASAA